MSAATMPTKMAAIDSIVSMMRSMTLRCDRVPSYARRPRGHASLRMMTTAAGRCHRRRINSPPARRRQSCAQYRAVLRELALSSLRARRDRRRPSSRRRPIALQRRAPPSTRRAARASACRPRGPAARLILARPAASKSAQGAASFSAHSVVQWSSITFFCAGDMASYLALFIDPDEGRDVERRVHVVLHHLVDAEQDRSSPTGR